MNFTINLNGTAYTGVAQLDEALGNVLVDVQKTQSWFGSLKDAIGASSIKLDAFIGVVEFLCCEKTKGVKLTFLVLDQY